MSKPAIAIIRPYEVAQQDLDICLKKNWQPILMSPFKIKAIGNKLIVLNQQANSAKVLFWVSPSAVNIAASFVDHDDQKIHVAVGEATAKALRTQGFQQVYFPINGHDSEAVLNMPLWKEANRVLIIRGENGRSFLQEKLTQLGWQVQCADVYQRVVQPLDWSLIEPLIKTAMLKAAYVTSSQSVVEWFSQSSSKLATPLKSLLYLTHHKKVAEKIQSFGTKAIVVSSLSEGLRTMSAKWSTFNE